MSALPPKADIAARNEDVRFVPKADVSNRSNLGSDRCEARQRPSGDRGA